MYIDTHVHLRDFNQTHKETIKHGLEVARDSGVDAVFDMPNTDPSITTEAVLRDRLKLARDANVPEVFYGVYLGVTADPEQVRKVVELTRTYREVVGLKLYAGHSVGNLGVVRFEDQQRIYEVLAREGYKGVLVVHAEKEECMNPSKWDPKNPITHCIARPKLAEFASVEDQIALALQTNFPGKLHIPHISTTEAVDKVITAKAQGLDISSGVCPHHLVFDWRQMEQSDGLLWKMNPPLRNEKTRKTMVGYLKEGKIDWVETDHAPHTLNEKLELPYMSGIPGLPWWPLFDLYLQQQGFSRQQIEQLTFTNAAKRFGLNIEKTRHKLVSRTTEYAFNPYAVLEARLSGE